MSYFADRTNKIFTWITGQSNINTPGNNSTVTEEHLKWSLRSAVEDKMKRRLREIFEQAEVF